MTWPAKLKDEIIAEFGPLTMFDRLQLRDGASTFRRSPRTPAKHLFERDALGRFLAGKNTGRRKKYRHKRDPRLLEAKRAALARMGAGESARSVARELGVNRATTTRWAMEERLVFRRGRKGGVDWRRTTK